MTITRAVHTPYSSYSSLDRAVLRLGLALVTWSRRTRSAGYSAVETDAERHEMRMAQQQAIEERRAAHTKALLLLNR